MSGRLVLVSSVDRPRREIDPRKSGAFLLAVLILAALASCSPAKETAPDPLFAAKRISDSRRWADEECRYLGKRPILWTYEQDGFLGVAAACVELPVERLAAGPKVRR